jgi:hypothetical protein
MQLGRSKVHRKTRQCSADEIPVAGEKDKQAMMFSGKIRPLAAVIGRHAFLL